MTTGFHHRVVVNPASGNGQGRRIGAMLPALFRRLGLAAEFHESRTTEHFKDLVRARSHPSERVVICGGDGSLNMALAAMAPCDRASVALVPCGRGNDVARSLHIPTGTEPAAALLSAGRERAIDVGYVGGRPFASIAAMGLDALVSIAAAKIRLVKGRMVYVLAALKELARYTPASFSIRSESFNFQGRAMMVSVANAPFYGGGMMLSPSSSMDDGLLEICIVLPMSKLDVMRLLPQVFSGRHVSSPLFLTAQSQSAVIASDPPLPVCADGEYLSMLPAQVRVEKAACRIVTPQEIRQDRS